MELLSTQVSLGHPRSLTGRAELHPTHFRPSTPSLPSTNTRFNLATLAYPYNHALL